LLNVSLFFVHVIVVLSLRHLSSYLLDNIAKPIRSARSGLVNSTPHMSTIAHPTIQQQPAPFSHQQQQQNSSSSTEKANNNYNNNYNAIDATSSSSSASLQPVVTRQPPNNFSSPREREVRELRREPAFSSQMNVQVLGAHEQPLLSPGQARAQIQDILARLGPDELAQVKSWLRSEVCSDERVVGFFKIFFCLFAFRLCLVFCF
jgi:hypothetical protein